MQHICRIGWTVNQLPMDEDLYWHMLSKQSQDNKIKGDNSEERPKGEYSERWKVRW